MSQDERDIPLLKITNSWRFVCRYIISHEYMTLSEEKSDITQTNKNNGAFRLVVDLSLRYEAQKYH